MFFGGQLADGPPGPPDNLRRPTGGHERTRTHMTTQDRIRTHANTPEHTRTHLSNFIGFTGRSARLSGKMLKRNVFIIVFRRPTRGRTTRTSRTYRRPPGAVAGGRETSFGPPSVPDIIAHSFASHDTITYTKHETEIDFPVGLTPQPPISLSLSIYIYIYL